MNQVLRQNIKSVPIEKLIPNTWNYNEQSEQMFEIMKENIAAYGMNRPVTVRDLGDRYEIINGFHRWLACKELGYKSILINDLGDVDDNKAKLLVTLLNEIHGEDNPVKLGALLYTIYGGEQWEIILKTLPFADEDIENFLKVYQEAQNAISKSVEEEAKKDVVYQLVVTEDQSLTIEMALAKFEDFHPISKRFYDIAVHYQAQS